MAGKFFYRHVELVEAYVKYRAAVADTDTLNKFIQDFCTENKNEILAILPSSITERQEVFTKELVKNLSRKMSRL